VKLNKFETADELQIASLRHQGMPHNPVIIRVVHIGTDE
jgi:hypothetical protein